MNCLAFYGRNGSAASASQSLAAVSPHSVNPHLPSQELHKGEQEIINFWTNWCAPKSVLIDKNLKINNNNFKRAGQVEAADLED